MVQSCSVNGSDFEWHSKTKQPNHCKSNQIAAILDSYVLVLFSNGQDYSYGPNHSHTEPSQTQNFLIMNGF